MSPKFVISAAGLSLFLTASPLRADEFDVVPNSRPPAERDGASEEGGKPVVKPIAPGDDRLLRSMSSSIIGLLVTPLDGGKYAGSASRMNIVAVPGNNKQERAVLKFNQSTGPMMTAALEEVRKFMTVRHGDWPTGTEIDISFEDKWTPKDGPSAAVACALMLEGLFTDTQWDPSLAVTGDMNSDGAVRKVGGVAAKIRGAVNKQCRIVAVPAGNADAVRDFVLMDGPQVLLKTHVYGLKTFDEARALARRDRDTKIATALSEFDAIINAKPAGAALGGWIRQPAVLARLKKVVDNSPNHLSARILLEMAQGGGGMTMSLAGSLNRIDSEAAALVDAIPGAKTSGGVSGLKEDRLGDAVMRLRKVRSRCHPNTVKLIDSLDDFGSKLRAILKNPPRYGPAVDRANGEIMQKAVQVDSAYSALRNDPAVREELEKN